MELYDYQKRLANFIAQHKNAVISVDMGLGKTAAVLAWLNWHLSRGGGRSGLIIAPKRVAENNWHSEAARWNFSAIASLCVVVAGTPAKRKAALSDTSKPIKILSRDNINDVKNWQVDFVIFDELTSFKSINAQRTKAALTIKAPIKIGLTGTICANGAIDIYAQMAVCGLYWGDLNFYGWRANYFVDAMAGSGMQWHKWRLNRPLIDLLKPVYNNIFTLTAADYLKIPAKVEHTRKIDVGDTARRQLAELDAFLATQINGETLAIREGAKFAKLQTLANGFAYTDDGGIVCSEETLKLDAVVNLCADYIEAGEPVLLFYAFRYEAELLKHKLKEIGAKYTDVNDKKFMQKWNAGEVDVLLAHPASAGHGLNLQHGGRVIIWSTLTYNFELFAQANARLARNGQTRQVMINYFIAAGTCEEAVIKALQRKSNEQNEFLKLTKQ